MESNTVALLTVVIVAVVAIAIVYARRWKRLRVEFDATSGKVKLEGSTESSERPASAVVERAESEEGGIRAQDGFGGGVVVRDAKAKGDISAVSAPPPEGPDLGNLGNAYQDLGELRRANDFYKRQLTIAREIHDRRGEGTALGNFGPLWGALVT
jgi:hypothetical protein